MFVVGDHKHYTVKVQLIVAGRPLGRSDCLLAQT